MDEEPEGLGPAFDEMEERVARRLPVPEYTGTIVKAEWVDARVFEGRGGGKQLHLEVRPLEFDVGGKTGLLHEFIRFSTQKASKWGAFRKGLEDAGVTDVKDITELEGLALRWRETDELPGGQKSVNPQTKKPAWYRVPFAPAVSKRAEKWEIFDGKLKAGLTKDQMVVVGKRLGLSVKEIEEYVKGLLDSGHVEEKDDAFWLT